MSPHRPLVKGTAPKTPHRKGGNLRKRNKEIHLHLSDEEYIYLSQQSEKTGLSRQSYLLALLKKTPIKEQPSADFLAILKALEKIGDNINQIAAKANTLGFIDRVQYRKDSEKLEKVIAELVRVAYS